MPRRKRIRERSCHDQDYVIFGCGDIEDLVVR